MNKHEILTVTKDVKLLYVEDDTLLRESSIELFKTFFKDIDVAIDGLEAVQMYEKMIMTSSLLIFVCQK